MVLDGAGVSREVAAVASVLLDDAAEMIDPDELSESVALIELVGDVGPVDDDVALVDDVSAESSAITTVQDEVDQLQRPGWRRLGGGR